MICEHRYMYCRVPQEVGSPSEAPRLPGNPTSFQPETNTIGGSEMETSQVACQIAHPALALIGSSPQTFARQGAVVASWREYRGRRLGPYFRLAWRDQGRQRSVYLGCCRALVDQVRQALAAVQAPLRRSQWLRRMKAEAKAALRASKAELDRQLRAVGLFLKGFEIRGRRRALCPELLAISPLSAVEAIFPERSGGAPMGAGTGKQPGPLTKRPPSVGADDRGTPTVATGKQPGPLTKTS